MLNKKDGSKNGKRKNYFMIDNDYVIHYARHLGIVATAVFTSLNMHADGDGKCFPSMELIAEEHSIDRHTVSKAINKLEVWNMIHVGKSYNRKLKRRKNNTYILIPRKFWRDLPVEDDEIEDEDYSNEYTIEDDGNKSHGTENATHMASRIPNDGTEDTSNKTHITRPIKEDSICGEPTELPLSLSKKLQLLGNRKSGKSTLGVSKSAVWDSNKAIQSLINNDCKDYQIIGEYFLIQKMAFSNKLDFEEKLKRSLRPAKALEEYPIDDIRKTMQWMNNQEFDMGWSLERVWGYIDDCFETDFIPNGEDRDKQLNIINA